MRGPQGTDSEVELWVHKLSLRSRAGWRLKLEDGVAALEALADPPNLHSHPHLRPQRALELEWPCSIVLQIEAKERSPCAP